MKGGEDSSARRRGRPVQFRAETPEAEELARWLYQLTERLPARELADRFEYNKTKWAQFRNGSQLIPRWLLEKVVRELVPEPALQQRMLATGRRLLSAAERAAAGMPSRTELRLPEQELKARLEETQRGQEQAQTALAGMTQLTLLLLSLVSSLTARCQELEDQRVSAQHLQRYYERLARAEDQLEEARQSREDAEELRLQADLQAERYRRALNGPSTPASVSNSVSVPQPLVLDEHECDHLLEANASYLSQARRALNDLRSRLGLPLRADPAGNFVRGQLVDKEQNDKSADQGTEGASQGAAEDQPRRSDPRALAVIAITVVVVLLLVVALIIMLMVRKETGEAGRTPPSSTANRTTPPANAAARKPSTASPTPPSLGLPATFRRKAYEPVITVGKGWSTPDRTVRVNVPGGSTGDGPSLFITTPTTSCPYTNVPIGDGLVVREAGGSSWTRITVIHIWAEDLPAEERTSTAPPWVMYTKLLVEQGPDNPPKGKRCG
jgi:hypothetical protein